MSGSQGSQGPSQPSSQWSGFPATPRPRFSRSTPPSLGMLLSPMPDDEDSGRPRSTRRLPAPSKSPPPRRPLPSEAARPTRSDPAQPRRAWLAEQLIVELEVFGRQGLQDFLYKYAEGRINSEEDSDDDDDDDDEEDEETGKGKASWGYLLKDRDEGTNHVMTLLQALPDCVLMALLREELPLQGLEDPRVSHFISRHMRLTPDPGIYVNLLHSIDGGWLSSKDMGRLLDTVEDYITVDPSGKPRPEQSVIDQRLSAWRPRKPRNANDIPSPLRWLEGKRAAEVYRVWIKRARHRFCDNATDPDQPFPLSCSEVGWSYDVKNRCQEHMNNSNTTYLWGLVQSILRMPRPLGFGFPEPTQLMLFPLYKREENYCRVAEVLGSVVCSSYWFMNGLNCTYAGTFNWQQEGPGSPLVLRPPASTSSCWDNNAQAFWGRLQFEKPGLNDVKKLRRLNEMRRNGSKLAESEKEHEMLKEKVKEAAAKRDAQKLEIRKLRQDNAEARRELAARSGRQEDVEMNELMEKLMTLTQEVADSEAEIDRQMRRLLR